MFRVFESIAPFAFNAVPLATVPTFLHPRCSLPLCIFWALGYFSFVSLERFG